MSRQVEHLVRLIDDLLDVSRISRGKIELRRERIDLTTVVQQAVDTTRSLYETSSRRLSVELPPTPLNVHGDATRLTQVISNLLTNGVRYTGENGHVRVLLDRVGNEARLRVCDNGIGLAPEQLDAVFGLFVQVDNSLARSQGGLGLGLTLVRKLVEMHGGRVEARSDGLGRGSEFLVYLPLIEETSPTIRTPNEINTATTTARRILVVDDNRDAADTLAMLLTLKKNEAHTRYGGRDAIDAIGNLQPDVVLLDIGMPELDGYETCRQMRQLPGGDALVLIALTGYGQEDDKRRATEAGFDGHLTKPVDMASLNALLNKLPGR